MASGAGDDEASLAKAAGGGTSSPVKKNEPVPLPFPWKDLPSLADVCMMPVLGVADELWPELGTVVAAKGKGKGKAPSSSSSTALDAPITMAPPLEQGSISKQSGGASNRRHGGRAGSSAAVVPSSPMHGPNSSRERRAAAAPEQPPANAPSHHRCNNNAGARGHHQQQSGRFVPHPHGRGGGEGYNRGGGGGGGNRRPPVGGGGANGRGDANGNGNAYRNRGGGGFQRQEHRGGFNGLPRGRGHQDDHRGSAHRPLRPPMGYVDDHHGPGEHRPQLCPPPMGHLDAPPHHMHPAAPSFMGMVPPPMPYPYYYGMPYGYPEFFPGYFAPPLQGPPFMQYGGALPQNHIMQANLGQQTGPMQTELQQHQPVPGQQTPPGQENQQTLEQLRQVIRQQIEYYFSTENLDGDIYLRARMDEQGWVPLTLIAGFNEVCSKTTNMELILDSILPSTEVDVVDGKIRKRVGWERYTSVKNSSEATTSQ